MSVGPPLKWGSSLEEILSHQDYCFHCGSQHPKPIMCELIRMEDARRKELKEEDQDRLITVCASCLCASCWHGDFHCQNYQSANLKQVTRKELNVLGREHPHYYSDEMLKKIYGE